MPETLKMNAKCSFCKLTTKIAYEYFKTFGIKLKNIVIAKSKNVNMNYNNNLENIWL